MGIGNKIKEARTKMNLTQEQAAETLMVSRQTVSNWENGRSLPDIVSVIKMSELYQISLDELLKGDSALMKKIEKDTKLVTAEKKFMRYAWFSIAIYIVVLTLGEFFEGNPVVDFLNGATPGVLLGVGFLLVILHLNKLEEEK